EYEPSLCGLKACKLQWNPALTNSRRVRHLPGKAQNALPLDERQCSMELQAGRKGASPFLNRRSDDIAVFGPTAVVILHVVEAEQIFQHKPGMTRSLANATVGDGRFLG